MFGGNLIFRKRMRWRKGNLSQKKPCFSGARTKAKKGGYAGGSSPRLQQQRPRPSVHPAEAATEEGMGEPRKAAESPVEMMVYPLEHEAYSPTEPE